MNNAAWSTLIGRGMLRLGFDVLKYAIKNQLKACKILHWGVGLSDILTGHVNTVGSELWVKFKN